MWTYKSSCLDLLWKKNEKTSKTVANKCNEKSTKIERRFDVTLGYSITVRDVSCGTVHYRSTSEPTLPGSSLVFFKMMGAYLDMFETGMSLWPWKDESRTFVPTDIRSHAIFDRAGHSCSHQMTTPDIRAHIKLTPRTFVLISTSFHLSILYMRIPSY